MKFLPLLALIGAPAFAQDDTTQHCALVGEIAGQTLEAYTIGVFLGDMIDIAAGDELLIEIIMDAYDEPRYSTDEVIDEAIFDFRNKWERDCFQYFHDKQKNQ